MNPHSIRGALPAAVACVLVGASFTANSVLGDYPYAGGQFLRYALACLLLVPLLGRSGMAPLRHLTGRRWGGSPCWRPSGWSASTSRCSPRSAPPNRPSQESSSDAPRSSWRCSCPCSRAGGPNGSSSTGRCWSPSARSPSRAGGARTRPGSSSPWEPSSERSVSPSSRCRCCAPSARSCCPAPSAGSPPWSRPSTAPCSTAGPCSAYPTPPRRRPCCGRSPSSR